MTIKDLLTLDPSIYPLALNDAGDLVFCIDLSEEDYRQASFLDDRVLRENQGQGVIRWQELESAAATLPLKCDFLFHTSHAGSTLISRLLVLTLASLRFESRRYFAPLGKVSTGATWINSSALVSHISSRTKVFNQGHELR